MIDFHYIKLIFLDMADLWKELFKEVFSQNNDNSVKYKSSPKLNWKWNTCGGCGKGDVWFFLDKNNKGRCEECNCIFGSWEKMQ